MREATAFPVAPARVVPASYLVLAVGAIATGVYYLLPGERSQDLAYCAIGSLSTAVMVLAILRRRPAERSGWIALAAANALWVAGDAVGVVYDLVLRRDLPFPSVADALYLAGYPLLFLGVARVTRVRAARGSREAYADAAIVSVGALALLWHLLIQSYTRDAGLSQFGKIVTLAYPVMDVGVLFIVVTAVITGAARRPAEVLLGAALAVMLAVDLAYDLLVLHGAYAEGGPVDAGFLLSYVLMAAAALHPSVADRVPERDEAPVGRLWLPLVAASAFVPPTLIVACTLAHTPIDAGVLAGTSIVLTALAVLRATWLVGHLRHQTAELAQRGESLARALDAQQALEHDLRQQAFHDGLTGMANRALFHDRLEHALEAPTGRFGTVWLLVVDLDGFTAVNDGSGDHVGDAVLLAASRRIHSLTPAGNTVARLGGDEFAILLTDVESVDDVRALATRVVTVLREPIALTGRPMVISASVGVACAGPDATNERLLAEAGAALRRAKAQGKDRFAIFDAGMYSQLGDRMVLTHALQAALEAGEFELEFQPQARLADGALEGFEALVRWRHPTLGTVGPVRFVPLAEETGFVVPLGRWVLEQACLEAARWAKSGAACTVSVNVSGRQLQDARFGEYVRAALATSGLAPEHLVLEVTETVLMTDPTNTAAILAELKDLGVRIAIDDFGTGYSSLSYLRQFPADVVKIDKSFIDPLLDPSDEGRAFVQTILRLAADLGLKATAEGVEHERQWRTLQGLGCHSVQGYLLSPPLDRRAARAYLARVGGPATATV